MPKRQPEVLHSAHAYNVLHCMATKRAGPSETATDATNATDPGQGMISLPTHFQHDETLSGQDLLQELHAVQAEDLDVKGDIRCDNYLNGFDTDGALGQDAAFDEMWNACSGVVKKELIDGGHYIVESRIAPFKSYVESENQPPVCYLNKMGPRELLSLDHRPASVCSDSFQPHASPGE